MEEPDFAAGPPAPAACDLETRRRGCTRTFDARGLEPHVPAIRDICLIGNEEGSWHDPPVMGEKNNVGPRWPLISSPRVFYSVFLPLGAGANLVLGLVVLRGLNPNSDIGWLQLGSGAFCCMVAGWLAAAAWSRFYWNRNLARQVVVWRRIADAIFGWLEEAPPSAEALYKLKSSLDEVVPSAIRQ
jgi:hypothetical protein